MSMTYEVETQRAISDRPFGHDNVGDMLTKQEFKDDCDINMIMIKYRKTGELEHVKDYLGTSTDNYERTIEGGYQEMRNSILEADQAFAELPSAFRASLENDPGQFLAWIDNPENRPEAVEMGLLPPLRQSDEVAPEKPAGAPPTTSETESD